MMILANPYRGTGLPPGPEIPDAEVSHDPERVLQLLTRCPVAESTPATSLPRLAELLGVGDLWVKDERDRMGLGSFKALGAAYAIADEAARRTSDPEKIRTALQGLTFVAASAGNHGLSVAAGARVFGAEAVIFLSQSVSESFERRLHRHDARVERAGSDYEESMAAAAEAAQDHDWILLSDSTWPGYVEPARRVMEGYLAMASEAADALKASSVTPTHVFLQAGVGGMAASVAAYWRSRWSSDPVITVVEPERAAALQESIRAGRPVRVDGLVSNMGRLDCKEPSHLALASLARDADFFMTITDSQADETVRVLAENGLETTPSGAAGLAGLHHVGDAAALTLSNQSTVLAFVTEARTSS